MSQTPIASNLEDDYNMANSSDATRRRGGLTAAPSSNSSDSINVNTPNTGAAPDFMGTLLDAQQVLISANHQFLHDSNVGTLYQAQTNFIAVQNEVIQRLLGQY